MIVLITGASGFLGSRTVKLALERGHEVRAFVRSRNPPAHPNLSPENMVIGDMTDPASFISAVKNANAVIHCAAITSEGKPDWALSRRVNVEGTRNLINAVQQHGAPNARWIQISSMSAHPVSTSAYGVTKREADDEVKKSNLPWTILRPSIIYGPGGKGLVSKTLSLMQKLPVLPVVGSGHELLRPIYVDDVARAALDCIENKQTFGKSYMLGGADEISFNGFLHHLANSAGLRRPLIHIPIPVALLLARSLGIISKNPPITADNVLGIKQLQRVEIAPAIHDFGFQPVGFEEGLKLTFAP